MGNFDRSFVPCAYDSCAKQATIRKHKKNLCLEHYDEEAIVVALKWNHDNGLVTDEQRQKFVFENNFSFKKLI